jgi:hypothetical protein
MCVQVSNPMRTLGRVLAGCATWCLALSFSQVWAQAPESVRTDRGLHISPAAKPPLLADYVAGSFLPEAKPITGFRQRNPDDGKPVSQETTAWISYDTTNIYVIFVCKVAPGELRARFSKRDDIMADDMVGVLLDTFHDRQHAYEFFVNPFGIQLDGINTEGQGDDFSFDTYWNSEGRILLHEGTPDGYAVRITIPFKSLRFTKRDMQTWGIALIRNIPGANETAFWPYITNKKEEFVPQFSEADGLESIRPGHNLRFIPYIATTASHNLEQPTGAPPSFQNTLEPRAGFDAKVVLHESLTLDATVNPDFSQVESDDPQVTTNQRFEVFFPEKRPFFLENASYFQTPQNLFFSRRIADPDAGARLTGRLGQWSLGVLAAGDRGPGKALDPTDPNYGDTAAIGVVRIQRNIFTGSTIGMFSSDREIGDGHNRVESLDTRLKLSSNLVLTGQAMYSDTRNLDGTHSVGAGYFVNLNRSGLHLNYYANYLDLNPGFHTDLGFVPRVDIRQGNSGGNYLWRPSSGPISFFGPFLNLTADWARTGLIQDGRVNPGFIVQLRRATVIQVAYNRALEVYQNVGFHEENTSVYFNSDRFKKAGVQAFFGWGTGLNYSPADGVMPFLAGSQFGNTTLTFRPSARLRIQQTYFYTRLAHVFTNHIFRSTVLYQFTPAFSLRTIVDYNAVLTNSSVVNYDQTKRFTGDILFTYLPHPGTAVYVGYTNSRQNLALMGPDGVSQLTPYTVLTRNPSLQTEGQLFVKLSYLFRF